MTNSAVQWNESQNVPFQMKTIIDDTRSVESLILAECQKLDFPVLRKQLCHPRFASGSQCMTSMTVKNKRHFNPSCSRLAIK